MHIVIITVCPVMSWSSVLVPLQQTGRSHLVFHRMVNCKMGIWWPSSTSEALFWHTHTAKSVAFHVPKQHKCYDVRTCCILQRVKCSLALSVCYTFWQQRRSFPVRHCSCSSLKVPRYCWYECFRSIAKTESGMVWCALIRGRYKTDG